MDEKRYTFKELLELYQVDSKTLILWARDLRFPLFSVSPYKRYARESDIREWENTFGKWLFESGSRTVRIPEWMR
jgi:hypothetical protein